MGSEAKCRAEIDGKHAEGTALLETEELIFRGPFRAVFRFAEISSAEAREGSLILVSKNGARGVFHVGARAAKWLEKIRSPPGRLKKLGVDAACDVTVTGAPLDDGFLDELRGAAKSVREGAPTRATRVLFVGVAATKDLSKLSALRARLADDAPLWVVYPKGKKDPSEGDVLAAGRAAGMKDVKVARFSDTHTALKFVVPLAARKR